MQAQVDLFNVFNKSTVLGYRSTNYATAAYLQPAIVLQGRIVRLAYQICW